MLLVASGTEALLRSCEAALGEWGSRDSALGEWGSRDLALGEWGSRDSVLSCENSP